MTTLATDYNTTVNIPFLERIKSFTAFQIIFASLFIGICAQIKIPLFFTPVPVTGQTFAVLLIGTLLGSKKGALAALCYLFEGALGLPVFAGGSFGILRLIGPTGGYLFATILQAYLMGKIVERQKTYSFTKTCAAISSLCCLQLAIGSIWLANFVPLKSVFLMGFYPFIPGEIAKSALIATLLKWKKSQ